MIETGAIINKSKSGNNRFPFSRKAPDDCTRCSWGMDWFFRVMVFLGVGRWRPFTLKNSWGLDLHSPDYSLLTHILQTNTFWPNRSCCFHLLICISNEVSQVSAKPKSDKTHSKTANIFKAASSLLSNQNDEEVCWVGPAQSPWPCSLRKHLP